MAAAMSDEQADMSMPKDHGLPADMDEKHLADRRQSQSQSHEVLVVRVSNCEASTLQFAVPKRLDGLPLV